MTQDNALLADRLVRSAVLLTRWLRAADPAPQLSGPQASALAIIVNSDGIKPSALATLEEVKRPTIARTIAQLEALGLIARHPDAADGRSVTLRATSQGQAVFEAGQQRRLEPLRAALDRLPASTIAGLDDAVSMLQEVLDRETRGR
jgi:DNA-binding MarR family transcriptional regulator